MWVVLLSVGCGPGHPDQVATAGKTERARADAFADCAGVVHDADLYAACAMQRIAQLRTPADVLPFCATLGTHEAACRDAWVERMINRSGRDQLLEVCPDEACHARVEEQLAWRDGVQEEPTVEAPR